MRMMMTMRMMMIMRPSEEGGSLSSSDKCAVQPLGGRLHAQHSLIIWIIIITIIIIIMMMTLQEIHINEDSHIKEIDTRMGRKNHI